MQICGKVTVLVGVAILAIVASSRPAAANGGVEPGVKPAQAPRAPTVEDTLAELSARVRFLEESTRSVYCGSADIDAGTSEVVHFGAATSRQSVILIMYGERFSSFHYTELPYHVHRLPPLPHSHDAGNLMAEPEGTHTHSIGVPGMNQAQLAENAVANTRVRRSPGALNRNIIEPTGKHIHTVAGFTGQADPGGWFDEALERFVSLADAASIPYIRPFCTGSPAPGKFDPLVEEAPRKEALSQMAVVVDGSDFAAWYATRTGARVDLSGSLGMLRGRRINITSLLGPGPEHSIEFRQRGWDGGKIRYRVEVLNRLLPEEPPVKTGPARPSVEAVHEIVPAEEAAAPEETPKEAAE